MDRFKRWGKWVWCHRTKTLGLAAVGIGYVQNNLAQLGHFLSPRLEGSILGVFGVLAFAIGLWNTFARPDPQ